MKSLRKIMALLIAMVMVLGMSVSVFAQTVGTAREKTGTITIKNAAKGETYKVYKLFDATVGEKGAISYTGNIPDGLKDYFTKDTAGNISKAEGKTDAEIAGAVQAWGATATGAVAEAVSDGSVLTFAGLSYGYYAVTSSQGATVSVDSTNPAATITDKNSKTIIVTKDVEKQSYSIGDTVKYTATFNTVNYLGAGEAAKQVIKYDIQDTLPEFLSNVNVVSIKVDGVAIETKQFDENKTISIPWATEDEGSDPKTYTNTYRNGAVLEIVYTAKLTSVTNINKFDTNTVSLHPTTWDGTKEEKPWDDKWQDDAEIITYAAALKKTDGSNPLKGAQFTIKGLTVEGQDGEYTVVSYDPESTTQSSVLDTNDEGVLYIIGLANDVKLTVTETKAPDGYNKLTDPVTVPAQVLSKEIYKASGTIKYDAKGNVIETETTATTTKEVEKNLSELNPTAFEVINNAGSTLPSTGGMGTTLFYIVGGILVAGAAIILIAKRKVNA